MVSIVVLLGVFVLVAIRQVGRVRFQIWQVMLLGALAVLATGQISPSAALRAIDLDVMLFLLGMFIVGQALDESGYLSYLSYSFFGRARSLDRLILSVLFGMGILSAFLMNDTLAIIGTPVVLLLAQKTGAPAKVLLLSLAFALTIGSVMSPIGNPQNLLIAINGNLTSPFVIFFKYLMLPTLVNLFLAYLLLRLFYKNHFRSEQLNNSPEPIKDQRLTALAKVSLILLVVLMLAKIITVLLGLKIDFRLTYIALASAFPIVLSSKKLLEHAGIDALCKLCFDIYSWPSPTISLAESNKRAGYRFLPSSSYGILTLHSRRLNKGDHSPGVTAWGITPRQSYNGEADRGKR